MFIGVTLSSSTLESTSLSMIALITNPENSGMRGLTKKVLIPLAAGRAP